MLTKNLASEWGEFNIQVNGLGPGYIETPQTAPLRVPGHPFNEFIIAKTPAARWGTTEDLAGAGYIPRIQCFRFRKRTYFVC